MFLLIFSLLGAVLTSSVQIADQQGQAVQSKEILAEWAPAVFAVFPQADHETLLAKACRLDAEFGALNVGVQGSLNMLGSVLIGKDFKARRGVAVVIGSLRQGGVVSERDAEAFRSEELKDAAKLVSAKDAATAQHATDAMIRLLDGERWDQQDQYWPMWSRSLSNATGWRAENLAKLFAFTSIPIAGAVPALYRLSRSSNGETRRWAICALGRASLVAPSTVDPIVFAEVDSKSATKREFTYRGLEALATVLWDSQSARKTVEESIKGKPFFLMNAWCRSSSALEYKPRPQTWITRSGPRRVFMLVDPTPEQMRRRAVIIQTLRKGLVDPLPSIRVATTKTLVLIGKQIDSELNRGNTDRTRTNKMEIAELLSKASVSLQKQEPLVAKQAHDTLVSLDRERYAE